jgi:hypothetical protein
MPSRADIYAAGYALADRLWAEYGTRFGWGESRVRRLEEPYRITLRHGSQVRDVLVPAGWFEGVCFFGPVDLHLGISELGYRTWSWNEERTRRKAQRAVIGYALREHAAGRWPHARATA